MDDRQTKQVKAAEMEAKVQTERATVPTLMELERQKLIEIGSAISNLIDAVKTLSHDQRDCMGSTVARQTHLALAAEHLAKLRILNP